MGTTSFEAAYHVEQARLRGGIPTTDSRFTTTRMLNLLTDELHGMLAPLVHNAKSDHGVVPHTVAATAGTARYTLPPGAFANTLRDVYWIDADDKASPIHPISAADPRVYTLRNDSAPRPSFYALQGSSVILYPTPSANGTLALPHYARPARLSATFATISTVTDLGAGLVALALTSAAPAALNNQTPLHLVRGTPGFETIVLEVGASWNSTSNITISAEDAGIVAGDIAAGDYVALPGESPVPQIPVELFPLLHARVAYVAVPSTGDMSPAAQALAAQVADLDARAREYLRPRVESASPPVGRGLDSNPMLRGLV